MGFVPSCYTRGGFFVPESGNKAETLKIIITQ